ncbi:hypothetical protein HZI73_10710 [Vallitalea pronyensis]|uniref:Uncharacterized protein n=1 Tax=Vallitalea pronyensis TaxID=1348613 RepID=A0A8J8MJU3_9FIRM|nr:hypothetical protein [Vallitalea pronyensis]QUI22732.1 hypothetical protein HZI73_10710 [Vallitalea pronyensis]
MKAIKGFFSHIKNLEQEELEQFFFELESELRRLRLLIRCCESKIESIDPYSDDFERLVDDINNNERKADTVCWKVMVTRVEINQRKDRYIC